MHLDVADLNRFYYRSALGALTRRALRQAVEALWPPEEMRGLTLAGFGYPVPVMRGLHRHARRTVVLMPGAQGVAHWPSPTANVAALVEEAAWPIETGHVDRLIVLHGVEASETPAAVMDEAWRVLGPGGRVLFVVPNRAGLWARRDITPFGYGRPFSLRQLEAHLVRHRFEPLRHSAALFMPPLERRVWLRWAPAWERIGRRLSGSLAGGVLLIEAGKRVWAPRRPGLTEMVRRPLGVLEGLGRPVGAGAPRPARVRSALPRRQAPRGTEGERQRPTR